MSLTVEEMYQKVVAVALECDPKPASERGQDTLEPPWLVFRRIKRELAEALRNCGHAVHLCGDMREQRDRARDENALLRPLYDELKGCKWSADDGGENKLAVMLANLERYYARKEGD